MLKGKSLSQRRLEENAVTAADLPVPRVARRMRHLGLGIAITALAIFFGVLFYAEIAWLHQALPQDRASRVTLAVLPREEAGQRDDVDPYELAERVTRLATDDQTLRALVDRLDLRDESTGAPRSPQALKDGLHVSSQCIVQGTTRGVLVSLVVRGADSAEVERIANAWSDLLVRRSAAELSDVAVQPADALGATYEICQ